MRSMAIFLFGFRVPAAGIQMLDYKERSNPFGLLLCGADETRTRDPMRDRHVF